eukprot:COSAG01_NODE_5684_length_4102_cov_2.406695_6_plen_122_part_00
MEEYHAQRDAMLERNRRKHEKSAMLNLSITGSFDMAISPRRPVPRPSSIAAEPSRPQEELVAGGSAAVATEEGEPPSAAAIGRSGAPEGGLDALDSAPTSVQEGTLAHDGAPQSGEILMSS